ncbi:hypothetical protein FALCPG4_010896 [Fusarium falciforme]
MYMGMRKVTARLQRYLDDCDDEDTAQVFSTLVSDTIDGIDLLAELAEHLELHFPVHIVQMADLSYNEEKRREAFSESLLGISIDFLAFDNFEIEAVPAKRLKRLYQFLDQMQGFSSNKINFGEARGDLKRLGSSLLHALIYKVNDKNKFQATKESLGRLAKTMGVTRNQYPFDQREPPMDMDKQENLPERWPTDEWKNIRQQLLDDEKRRKKEAKKPWKNKGESSKDKDDPVANVQKRMEILKKLDGSWRLSDGIEAGGAKRRNGGGDSRERPNLEMLGLHLRMILNRNRNQLATTTTPGTLLVACSSSASRTSLSSNHQLRDLSHSPDNLCQHIDSLAGSPRFNKFSFPLYRRLDNSHLDPEPPMSHRRRLLWRQTTNLPESLTSAYGRRLGASLARVTRLCRGRSSSGR